MKFWDIEHIRHWGWTETRLLFKSWELPEELQSRAQELHDIIMDRYLYEFMGHDLLHRMNYDTAKWCDEQLRGGAGAEVPFHYRLA